MLKLDGMNLMCDETLIATVPMATISILETALRGQEETAILLEEQARRIATLQESLTSALGQFVEAYHKGLIGAVPDVPPAFVMDSPGHPPSPFITRNLLEEMVRKAETALRTAEESSVVGLIDGTPAKQPEVIIKPSKALQNIDVTKRVLIENSCPSEFGLEDCEFNPETGCTLCCEDCWNQEVEE